VFKHQKNILNYQADFLLELKNNFNGDIPSIVCEIDEDGHASYTPEKEKFRQSVIEAFNNRIIHIPVKRTSTQKQIEEIAIKYEKIIRDLAKELTIEYGFEFDEQNFISILQDNTVEPAFIKMFFDNKTGDKKFRYYMSDVGDFLEYDKKNNYQRLRTFLTSSPHFAEDVDWKVQKVAPPHAVGQLSTEKKSGNEGNGGHNKKVIIMSRVCFNTLCIVSRKPRSEEVGKFFAKVHDVALDYAQRLRVKAITNIRNIKVNEEDAKKRMDEQVIQRVDKSNLTKLKQENKELQEKLDSEVAKTVELETTVEEQNKSLQIVRTNIHKATYQISVLEEEKRKMQKRMLTVVEELRVMKEISVSNELYEKKEAELKELTVTFREYKLKYNVLVKKYNGNVVKNKSEREVKDQEISLLLEQHQKKEREMSEQEALLLARISELEKMIKPDIKVRVSKPSLSVSKLEKPPEVNTKNILPAKSVVKPTNDLTITKSFLTSKTINALKDICRDKSLVGFSSYKTKNSLIDWMLLKLCNI
jgi:hypothetical protein